MSSTQDLMDCAGLTKEYLLSQLKNQIERGTPTVKSDMLKTALKMHNMLPSQRALPPGGMFPGGYLGGGGPFVPFHEVMTGNRALEEGKEVIDATDERGNAEEDGVG